LAAKPNSGITPAIDRQHTSVIAIAPGMVRASPPSLSIMRVPVVWSIAPATINSGLL
jgi:hypothetical protein